MIFFHARKLQRSFAHDMPQESVKEAVKRFQNFIFRQSANAFFGATNSLSCRVQNRSQYFATLQKIAKTQIETFIMACSTFFMK